MIRAARVDANQREIVSKLRNVGCSVLVTSQLKNAFDILAGYKGMNFAFEIKDGNKPPSARKLTSGEQEFFNKWNGQVDVIESFEDAVSIIEKKCREKFG